MLQYCDKSNFTLHRSRHANLRAHLVRPTSWIVFITCCHARSYINNSNIRDRDTQTCGRTHLVRSTSLMVYLPAGIPADTMAVTHPCAMV